MSISHSKSSKDHSFQLQENTDNIFDQPMENFLNYLPNSNDPYLNMPDEEFINMIYSEFSSESIEN